MNEETENQVQLLMADFISANRGRNQVSKKLSPTLLIFTAKFSQTEPSGQKKFHKGLDTATIRHIPSQTTVATLSEEDKEPFQKLTLVEDERLLGELTAFLNNMGVPT